MQDADREKDSASHQEPPKALRKASEDVSQPSSYTRQTNKLSHHASFTKMPSLVR